MANYVIRGTITCSPEELDMFLAAVTKHIDLTRAEAGCIEFDIVQREPGSWTFDVHERFTDRAAFDAHTKRTRESAWWNLTRHIPRELTYSGG